MNDRRLIVFARMPAAGRVKTRLVPPLTREQAGAVYEALLLDVVERARATPAAPRIRYDEAPGASAFFAARFPDLCCDPQGPGDLGARLDRTFTEEFASEADCVAVIGSDSPTLPEHELRSAFTALAHNDVVLGPALDGGYYLIALRRAAWPRARVLFASMPWSSEQLLSETQVRLICSGLEWTLLSPWYDVDCMADLRRAVRDSSPESHLARLLNHELAASVESE